MNATEPEASWQALRANYSVIHRPFLPDEAKVDARRAFQVDARQMLTGGPEFDDLLRGQMVTGWRYVLDVFRYANANELTRFLPQLAFLINWPHGDVDIAQDLIRSLPRDWLIEHIEEAAEPLLHEDPGDELSDIEAFGQLRDLYEELDTDMALRLVRRAIQNPKPDIRNAGLKALKRLSPGSESA